jgi:hypothetical protein
MGPSIPLVNRSDLSGGHPFNATPCQNIYTVKRINLAGLILTGLICALSFGQKKKNLDYGKKKKKNKIK